MLRVWCNALLISTACVITAAKLHHRGLAGVVVTAQEVNRCLSMVRAAASRGLQDTTGRRVRRAGVQDV